MIDPTAESLFANQPLLPQRPQKQPERTLTDFNVDDSSDFFSFEDTLLAIPRGIEGFGRSIATLIPGVDLTDEKLFGQSDTVFGAGLESLTQFAIGFVPGIGLAGALGKVGVVADSAAAIGAIRGGKFFLSATEGLVAGATADFLSFDGHEKNFSSLIESIPGLANPLTDFLATDENDSQVESRIKNVLEGVGLGAAFGVLIESVKGLRAVRKARKFDATLEEVKNAQKGAVDPGRANEGLVDTLDIKARKVPEGDPGDVSGPSKAGSPTQIKTPKEAAKLVDELIGGPDASKLQAAADEVATAADQQQGDAVLGALADSKKKRAAAGGNPRKMDPQELIDNVLTEENANLDQVLSDEGGAHYLRALEDLFMVKATADPITHAATLRAATRQAAEMAAQTMGKSADEFVAILQKRLKAVNPDLTLAEQQRAMMATSQAVTAGVGSILSEQNRLAIKILKASSEEVAAPLRAQHSTTVKALVDLTQDLFDVKSSTGQLLNSFKAEIRDSSALRGLTDAAANPNNYPPRLLERIKVALGDGVSPESVNAALEINNMTFARKVAAVTNTFFYNSLLGSFKTTTVQVFSAANLAVLLPLENIVGGTLTRNSDIVKRGMAQIMSLHSTISDSASYAWKAFKAGKPLLDPSVALRDDKGAAVDIISPGLIGAVPGTHSATAMTVLGKIIGFPTQAIIGVDELSKQVIGRSAIIADKTVEGLGKGMSHAQARNFAMDEMHKLVIGGQLQTEAAVRRRAIEQAKKLGDRTPQELLGFIEEFVAKNFDESSSPILDRAVAVANEATLQTPLEFGSLGQQTESLLNATQGMRYIIPFYRTPLNAAKFVAQRLDIPAVARYHLGKKYASFGKALEESSDRFIRDMLSTNPNAKAEAVGRVATGLGLITLGGTLSAAGLITGRGPSDNNERRALTDAGWQPYSIKTPNGYVQFIRMDPVGSFLALAADMGDATRMLGEDDGNLLTDLSMAALISASNTFTQRSFLQGLGAAINAIEDPSVKMESVVAQFASAIIPSSLAQVVSLTGDDALKETNGILERIISRTPGLSATATPRRNMFGEVINRSKALGEDAIGAYYGLFIPISYREVSSDAVRIELANLKHGFNPPTTRVVGIDLRNVVSDRTGQSAHDRWAELQGKVNVSGQSIKAALSRLIRSRNYRKLPELGDETGPSPRVRQINSIVSDFRSKAFDRMLQEFPELRSEIANRRRTQQARRAGIDLFAR